MMAAKHRDYGPLYPPLILGNDVFITGGTFIQNISVNQEKAALKILRKNVAHTALHDSGARFDPPKCHPHTRVAVLQKIMDWLHGDDLETQFNYIMWLTGAAGAGKSAIAQTILELCLKEGLLLASFFFDRSDATGNHTKFFVATLAYQIFRTIPETQPVILSAINYDPLIFTQCMDRQFDALFVQPLRHFYKDLDALDKQYRRLVIIDGLDECLDRKVQVQLLNVLRNAIRKYKLPVIFLVASRPEHEITAAFNSKSMDKIFARLYLDDTYYPDKDISLFLRESFEEIVISHPFKDQIPNSWPNPDSVKFITKKSSGQFVYAATVVRYVQSIRHHPHRRLDTVLNLRPPQGDLPFAQLDALYTMILSCATDVEKVLYTISLISHGVLGQNIRDFELSSFMSLEEGELDTLFCDLHSLVNIRRLEKDAPLDKERHSITVLHASLHDFLLDPMRSKSYFLDIETYRAKHLSNILRFLSIEGSNTLTLWKYFERNFQYCQSTADLMKWTSSFPLKKTLEMCYDWAGMDTLSFITSMSAGSHKKSF